ncbi:MAG: hypothetical protein HUJ98_14120 [Bacteroidaceae bacterium]|nr:hypothetical protein [Bacteroidaceae bacterium]
MKFLTDEIAIAQAAKYNLTNEYWEARRHGCNIIEALEEWIFSMMNFVPSMRVTMCLSLHSKSNF